MLVVKVRRLTGIMVYVPRVFLERFDESIVGLYPSRSEAVRRGMVLILKEVQDYEKHSRGADPETIPCPCGGTDLTHGGADEDTQEVGEQQPGGGRPHD